LKAEKNRTVMNAEPQSTAVRTEGLTPAARAALAMFGRDAKHAYGADLLKFVLFGSRARGDAHGESDLDVAVVLRKISDRKADRNRLADIAYGASSDPRHQARRTGDRRAG
jgi:hypothetical protein